VNPKVGDYFVAGPSKRSGDMTYTHNVWCAVSISGPIMLARNSRGDSYMLHVPDFDFYQATPAMLQANWPTAAALEAKRDSAAADLLEDVKV
jgi:hypothetical protein